MISVNLFNESELNTTCTVQFKDLLALINRSHFYNDLSKETAKFGNIQKGIEKNDWFVHNIVIAGYSIERRNYYAWMHYRIVFAMYVGNRLNEWWMGCRCWICAHSYWIAIPTRNLSNRQMRIWWYDDS